MGTSTSTARVSLVAGVLLTVMLAGCGSHDEGASRPTRSSSRSPSPSFTHVVSDDGCNMQVAPIRLAPYHPPAFESGPTAERIQTAKDGHGLHGYPPFPRVLDGLPSQGVEPHITVELIFYLPRPVDGLTHDQVLSHGGVVVSASRVGRRFERASSRVPTRDTRVRIGTSPGEIYRSPETSVNWITSDHYYLSLTAQRRPATLVSLARSLVC